MISLEEIDEMIRRGGPYMPRWGWHDDHRDADGTEAYAPALQQVRTEFSALMAAIEHGEGPKENALQLGLGECEASHDVLNAIFKTSMVTIDWKGMLYTNGMLGPVATNRWGGSDSHSQRALHFAKSFGPYDFLMLDAGHLFEDVRADHRDYGRLVRPGGIIAFHDALPREGYPELGVATYLEELRKTGVEVNIIGDEVGIAWIINK